jgi:hypothetical protein
MVLSHVHWKNNKLSEKFPNTIHKSQIGKLDTPNMQIHDR